MSQSGSRYITPTLQSNFNYSIGQVLERMNQGLILETWRAIKTLYNILPPEIHDNKNIQTHFNQMVQLIGNHNGGTQTFTQQRTTAQTVLTYLAEHNETIFREMYAALYAGNYLEKRPREIPTGQQRGLEEDQSS